MNAGATLETIVREVRPPKDLAERPYLQAVYDEPEYVVRNIWRLYGGWYDGAPSRLKPARDAEIGREIAALAGGIERLLDRARALAAAGDLPLASHLVDWAVAAEPDNRHAHAVRAEIYDARATASAALMTRGIFSAAAKESAARAGPP
jgi:alkyl sulfatase BDS1-like metallo-beta-lactamase superfamily hydrolase